MLTLKYALGLKKILSFDMFLRTQLFSGNNRTNVYIYIALKSSTNN
jgi:hypothetical protein